MDLSENATLRRHNIPFRRLLFRIFCSHRKGREASFLLEPVAHRLGAPSIIYQDAIRCSCGIGGCNLILTNCTIIGFLVLYLI